MIFPLLLPQNRTEFETRISKVRLAMDTLGIDALAICSTVNIYYLTGGVCRGCFYLPIDREPVFFMTPPAQASAVGDIAQEMRKPEQIPAMLSERGYAPARKVGLEFEDLYYSDVERLKHVFAEAEIADGSRAMRTARLVKTPYEIAKMRDDGMRQAEVYSRIDRLYREDMTDLQFQIEIERVLRLEGCLGYLRAAGPRMELNMGSVIAGDNADVPTPYDFAMGGAGIDPSLPVGASGKTMTPGSTVMVDMNGGFNGYQTDMTRCWAIGDVPARAVEAHECSRRILRDLENFGRAGAEISQMYTRAEEIAREAGLAEYFMGHRHHAGFIGHGVGIELNEAPVIMARNHSHLQENMTIALEPKFVIPGVGAVGVENTYVVRTDGLENLTKFKEDLEPLS